MKKKKGTAPGTRMVSIDIENNHANKSARVLCPLTGTQRKVLHNLADWLEDRPIGTFLTIEDEYVDEVVIIPDLKNMLDYLQQKCNVPAEMCKALAEGDTKFKFPYPDDDYD